MHKELSHRLLSRTSSCKGNHVHLRHPSSSSSINERKSNKNNSSSHSNIKRPDVTCCFGNQYFSASIIPHGTLPRVFAFNRRCYVHYWNSHPTHHTCDGVPGIRRTTWFDLQNGILAVGNTAKYHDLKNQQQQQQQQDDQKMNHRHENVPTSGESAPPIVVATKLLTNDIRNLDKTTHRLLKTPVGTLNPAATLQFTTSIHSWHGRAISNPYNIHVFEKCKELFYRMIMEAQVMNAFVHVDVDRMNLWDFTTVHN